MEWWHQHLLIAHERTEWQKEPSAEWKKEQLSHSCKADYQEIGGWNAVVTSATCTARWLMAGQHSRRDMARSLTDHQFLQEHWLSTSQLPRKTNQDWKGNAERNNLRVCAACGEEVGQETWWWQTMTICKKIRCHRNSRQQCQILWSVRDKRIRLSLCKRKSKNSSSSKTVIDTTRKPRARRCCWNRRRRQRGKKHKRFVDQEWKMDLSTSWIILKF